MKLNSRQLKELFEELRVLLAKEKYWRLGQGFFNLLADKYPELSEQIRGTNLDPFYNNKALLVTIPAICDEEAIAYWNNSNLKEVISKSK